MKFFLMRHAEAELFASSDLQRELTEAGRLRLQAKAVKLVTALADVDCIIHSPYVRTRQTAAVMADALGVEALIESPLWTPDSSPHAALEMLESYTEYSPLIITHMPLVALVESLASEGDLRFPAAFNCAEVSQIETEWPAACLGLIQRRF